jgi:hypothetical protein
MNRSYSHIHAACDPSLTDEYPDGTSYQTIELVFNDDPDRPLWRMLEPAVCTIDARRARELAFELLLLAEAAEQWEQAR